MPVPREKLAAALERFKKVRDVTKSDDTPRDVGVDDAMERRIEGGDRWADEYLADKAEQTGRAPRRR